MIREIDELNVLENPKSIPFEQYFQSMELTDAQKKKRIELAEDIEDSLLFLFALIELYTKRYTNAVMYTETIKQQFKIRFKDAISRNTNIDDYVDEYIDYIVLSLVDVTFKHIGEEYYLSNDRAAYIAENESNTVMNHAEYAQAVGSGKTKKQWIDMKDSRERATHLVVGGTVLPIGDYFVVGDSLMLYPKDDSAGAGLEEICGCRCTIKYF